MSSDADLLKRLFILLEAYFRDRDTAPLVDYKPHSELQSLLDLDRPGSEGDWERIFGWIRQYLEYGVKTSQPHFLNRLRPALNGPRRSGALPAAPAARRWPAHRSGRGRR